MHGCYRTNILLGTKWFHTKGIVHCGPVPLQGTPGAGGCGSNGGTEQLPVLFSVELTVKRWVTDTTQPNGTVMPVLQYVMLQCIVGNQEWVARSGNL